MSMSSDMRISGTNPAWTFEGGGVEMTEQARDTFSNVNPMLNAAASNPMMNVATPAPTVQAKTTPTPTPTPTTTSAQWVEHTTDDGQTYYYNASTGQSSWTKPTESVEVAEVSVEVQVMPAAGASNLGVASKERATKDLDLTDHVDVEVEDDGELSDDEKSDYGRTSIGGREWSNNTPARRSTINILGTKQDVRAADVEAQGPSTASSRSRGVVTRRFPAHGDAI